MTDTPMHMMADLPIRGGTIPALDQTRAFEWSNQIAKQRGIYGFDSRDMRSRSFNMLRSRLLKLHRNHGWRTFGIVSPSPAVGKSFVATNLSASLSRTPGIDTYLLDLDLRRGSIAGNFDLAIDFGMRQYLEGEVERLVDIAMHPQDQRLVILPTDNAQTHSAELLSSDRMDALIAAMHAQSAQSLFICDLPPVFANDDASIVTRRLDAYILVIEDGRTTKKQIQDAMHVLDQSPCAGVVLNRFSGGLIADSYGYGYGAGYGDYYK